ncbi:MAG TPA: hypothetical protein VGE39_15880 [Prosthecobacter sp.]
MSYEAQKAGAAASTSGVAIEVLETLVNRAYDRAKRWAGAVLILQGALYFFGALAVFWPVFTLTYPWVALPLALIGAEITRRAGVYKGLAETAKRHHEYFAGFGITPSGSQLADLRQSLRNELSLEANELLKKGITYASDQPHGPRRVLENLSESAWFTKHLAAKCVVWVASTVLLSLTTAISALLWSAESAASTPTGVATAKAIAATLIFLISVGTIRSWVGYSKLSLKAKDIDTEASRLLAGDPSEFEAQRLLAEYQLARSSAPLVPTWIWELHRYSLNEDWELKKPKR